jgi:hypothetical protein
MQLTKAQTIQLINDSTQAIDFVSSDGVSSEFGYTVDDFDDTCVQDKIDIIEICLDALREDRGVAEDEFNTLDTMVRDDICDYFSDDNEIMFS